MNKLNLNNSITESMIYDRISKPSNWKKNNYTITDEYNTILAYLISSIYNFMCTVDNLYINDTIFTEYTHFKNIFLPTKLFMECRDIKDFNEWEKMFNNTIHSNKVEKLSNSLDIFFGD